MSSPSFARHTKFPIRPEKLEKDTTWSNERLFWDNCNKKRFKSREALSFQTLKNLNWKETISSFWKNELNSDAKFWEAYLKKVGYFEIARLLINIFILSYVYHYIDVLNASNLNNMWKSTQSWVLQMILGGCACFCALCILQLDSRLLLTIFGISPLELWKRTSYLLLMMECLHVLKRILARAYDFENINDCQVNTGIRIAFVVGMHWYSMLFFSSVPFPHPFTLGLVLIKSLSVVTLSLGHFACSFRDFYFPAMTILKLVTCAMFVAALCSNYTCLTSARKVYLIQEEMLDMHKQKNEIIDWVVTELTVPLQYIVSPLTRFHETLANSSPTAKASSYSSYVLMQSIKLTLYHCHVIKLMASNTLVRTKIIESRIDLEQRDPISLSRIASQVLRECERALGIKPNFVTIQTDGIDACVSDHASIKSLISNLLYCASLIARDCQAGLIETPRSRSYSNHRLQVLAEPQTKPAQTVAVETVRSGSPGMTARSAMANLSSTRKSELGSPAYNPRIILTSPLVAGMRIKKTQEPGINEDTATVETNRNLTTDNNKKEHVTLKFSALRPTSNQSSEVKLEISLSYGSLLKSSKHNTKNCPIDMDSTVYLACKAIANSFGGSIVLRPCDIAVTMVVADKGRRTVNRGSSTVDFDINEHNENVNDRTDFHQPSSIRNYFGSQNLHSLYSGYFNGIGGSKTHALANWFRFMDKVQPDVWKGGVEGVRIGMSTSLTNLDFIVHNILHLAGIRNDQVSHVENIEEMLGLHLYGGSDGNSLLSGAGEATADTGHGKMKKNSIDFDVLVTTIPAICKAAKKRWHVYVVLIHGGVEYLTNEIITSADCVVPIPAADNDIDNLSQWFNSPNKVKSNLPSSGPDQDQSEQSGDNVATHSITTNGTLGSSFDFSEKTYFFMKQFSSAMVEENYFVWRFLYTHEYLDSVLFSVLTLILVLLISLGPEEYKHNVLVFKTVWELILPVGLLLLILLREKVYPFLRQRHLSLRKVVQTVVYIWIVIGMVLQGLSRFMGSSKFDFSTFLHPKVPLTFDQSLEANFGTESGIAVLYGRFYSLVVVCYCCSYYLPWPTHLVVTLIALFTLDFHIAAFLSVTGHDSIISSVVLITLCIYAQYAISLYYVNILYRKEYQQWRVALVTDEFLEHSVDCCLRDTIASITAVNNERDTLLKELKKAILNKRLVGQAKETVLEGLISLHKGLNHLTTLATQLSLRDARLFQSQESCLLGQTIMKRTHKLSRASVAPIDATSSEPSCTKTNVAAMCLRQEIAGLLRILLSCESEPAKVHIQVHPMLSFVTLDKRLLQVCLRYAINQSLKNIRAKRRQAAVSDNHYFHPIPENDSIGLKANGTVFGHKYGAANNGAVHEIAVALEPFDLKKAYRFGETRFFQLTVLDNGLFDASKGDKCFNRMQCKDLVRRATAAAALGSGGADEFNDAVPAVFKSEAIDSDYYSYRFVCTLPYFINSASGFGRQVCTKVGFGRIQALASVHSLMQSPKLQRILSKCEIPTAASSVSNHINADANLIKRDKSSSVSSAAVSRNNSGSNFPTSDSNYCSDNEDGSISTSIPCVGNVAASSSPLKHGKQLIMFEVLPEEWVGKGISSGGSSGYSNLTLQNFAGHGWVCLRTSKESVLIDALLNNDIDAVIYTEINPSALASQNGNVSNSSSGSRAVPPPLSVSPYEQPGSSRHRRSNFSSTNIPSNLHTARPRRHRSDAGKAQLPTEDSKQQEQLQPVQPPKSRQEQQEDLRQQRSFEAAIQNKRYEFVAKLRFLGFQKIAAILLESTETTRVRLQQSLFSMFDTVLVRPVLNVMMDELVEKVDAREVELLLKLYSPSFKLSEEDELD